MDELQIHSLFSNFALLKYVLNFVGKRTAELNNGTKQNKKQNVKHSSIGLCPNIFT